MTTLAQHREDRRVRHALARTIEMADAADAAAREAIENWAKTKDWGDIPTVIGAARVAQACGAAAQAWAAIHAATRYPGETP